MVWREKLKQVQEREKNIISTNLVRNHAPVVPGHDVRINLSLSLSLSLTHTLTTGKGHGAVGTAESGSHACNRE